MDGDHGRRGGGFGGRGRGRSSRGAATTSNSSTWKKVEPSSHVKDIQADVESLSIAQKSAASVVDNLKPSVVHNSKQVASTFTSVSSSDFSNSPTWKKVEPSSQVKDIKADIESLSIVQKSPASIVHNSKQVAFTSTSSSSSDFSNSDLPKSASSIEQPIGRESAIHTTNDADVSLPHGDKSAISEPRSKEETESSQTSKSFDICLQTSGGGGVIRLYPSLHKINKEKRLSISAFEGTVLRPGMVLLKNYISRDDQIKIVKKCRELGLGEGGFYQPGYRDGAEMHLKMMCLGKNWDPETGNYVNLRAVDQAKPPAIPLEFSQLVERIIQDSHEHLRKHENVKNVEKVLPSMTPNLCIVNFYAKTGRLGLHQDKDESPGSIDKGLPVVSISIGDAAEFCYGDFRDVENVKKVELKSGDVLVFGGKSRRIYHGVTKIEEKTAPVALLQESKLRPGRLNLTFREY